VLPGLSAVGDAAVTVISAWGRVTHAAIEQLSGARRSKPALVSERPRAGFVGLSATNPARAVAAGV